MGGAWECLRSATGSVHKSSEIKCNLYASAVRH